MEPMVLNPLYDGSCMESPKRPAQQQQQQQQRQQQQQPQGSARPSRISAHRCSRACLQSCVQRTPWLVVAAIAAFIGAQVTWFVYLDRFLSSALQLLDLIEVLPPEGLSHSIFILKLVLLVVTSCVGAVMLMLGFVVKGQRLQKKAATHRADWPHGYKSLTTVAAATTMTVVLWLVAAGYILLLCCTFTATGLALAGDVAAHQANSMSVASPAHVTNTPQHVEASLAKAKAAVEAAVQAAPPALRLSPWLKSFNSAVLPHLQPGKGNANALLQSSCSTACLDLKPVTSLLSSHNRTIAGCVCERQAVAQGQQLLNSMWRDGCALLAALVTLTVVATWLLMYCIVAAVTTWRDHVASKYCDHLLHQEAQHNGDISRWMLTAGLDCHRSGSETLSSFPAIDAPLDVQRPTQLSINPEYAMSHLSPSPGKQRKHGPAVTPSDQHLRQQSGPHQVQDVESPAVLQHSDDVATQQQVTGRVQPSLLPAPLPTVTPLPATLQGGVTHSSPAPTVAAARSAGRGSSRAVPRAPPGTRTAGSRQRWS